jgi:23S rRNA (adenine2503-C2)-methyltransferase
MSTFNPYLLDYSLPELENLAEQLGQRKYRGRILYHWIFAKGLDSFAAMSDLPKSLRAELNETFILRRSKLVEKDWSDASETTKFLWELEDGRRVESVWIPDGDRKTVCISSQVGCALACQFCQTGKMGFIRNLSSGEIIEQIIMVREHMGQNNTNIVFMGMGEPFQNYDNVIKAAKIFTDSKAFAIANRKVTISTAGVVHRIAQFTSEGHKMRLAISLNHSNESERAELMPITKKYGIDQLLAAAKEWAVKHKDRVTFEYVLIRNVNDSERHARELVALTRDVPCKINVIPLNSNSEDMQPPDDHHIEVFMQWLSKSPWMITVRRPRGRDIQAACGMLYSKNESKKLLEHYHFNILNS